MTYSCNFATAVANENYDITASAHLMDISQNQENSILFNEGVMIAEVRMILFHEPKASDVIHRSE
jgi:hypothetical protein